MNQDNPVDPVLPVTPAAIPSPTPIAAPNAYTGPAPDQDAKTMAMLCHLLGIFTGFIGPLVIWLMKKDQSPFVNDQGAQALNFHITLVIAYVVAFLLCFVCIGYILLPALFVVQLIFGILGAMKANNGEAYRYPLAIPFIK
jgi:uncharacterized Tic20 family protein